MHVALPTDTDRPRPTLAAIKGLGVRRQRVAVEAVLDYEVWLPPIGAQQVIVAAIGELEKASSARHAASERIDALLPAALNEAFALPN